MNKAELISALAKRSDISEAEAKRHLEATLAIITEQITQHADVRIPGFGTFGTRKRAARSGVNPKTGARIEIAARTAPVFSAGSKLKEAASSGDA